MPGIDPEWVRDTLTRIDQKMDKLTEAHTSHRVDVARELGEQEQRIRAAHRRIDDHDKRAAEGRAAWPTWIGVVLSIGGLVVAAAGVAVAVFK